MRLADALCNDKGYGAVEEDEEADTEERDAKEVGCDLRTRRGEIEAEHGIRYAARDELARVIVGALVCRVCVGQGWCRAVVSDRRDMMSDLGRAVSVTCVPLLRAANTRFRDGLSAPPAVTGPNQRA